MANIQLAKNLLYLRTLYNLKQDDIANLFITIMKNMKSLKRQFRNCMNTFRSMLPITVIFMLLVIGKNEDCVGSIGGIICGVQLIPLIGSILPTEIALKKNFDKNGTRR